MNLWHRVALALAILGLAVGMWAWRGASWAEVLDAFPRYGESR